MPTPPKTSLPRSPLVSSLDLDVSTCVSRTPLVVVGAEAAPGWYRPRSSGVREAGRPCTPHDPQAACAPLGRSPARVELRPPRRSSALGRASAFAQQLPALEGQTWTRRPEGALLHQSLRGRLRSSLKTTAGRTSRAARIGLAPQASRREAEGRSWPAKVRARPRTTNAAAQTISACSTTLSEIGCTPTSKTSTTTKAASAGASPPRRT